MHIPNVEKKSFPPLLTKKQVAQEFFSVTERTIDRWLLKGDLPIDVKMVVGGSVRFRTDVLLDYVAGEQTDNGGNSNV